jgi:histidine triad (HIT) family protein
MTATPAYDSNNIFAKIIRGEIPSVKVWENNDVLAIMDVFPQADGHVLVLHKKAMATMLFNLADEDAAALIKASRKIACAVNTALEPDGVRIAQFNGLEAGQTIFHVHFHVIPVYSGRGLRPHGEQPAESARLAEIAAKIRDAL